MSSRWDLPPLDTLVAFEAAARHLSFTRAGAEVARTQSAVSRQVQALEERLGVALFRRLPRTLELTEPGATLLAEVRRALESLDGVTRSLRARDGPRTVVASMTAGFAGLWLIPRLPQFTSVHPDVDVRISATSTILDYARDGIDIAIRYGPFDQPPPGSVRLFGEAVAPVCAPRLARTLGLREPADLARATLLRMPNDPGPPQDWGVWLEAMRLADLKPAGMLHFTSYDQLVHAAIDGQGVALGRFPITAALVRAKKLVTPFAGTVATPRGYSLLVTPVAAPRPEVTAFAAWLHEQALGTASPVRPAAPAPGSARPAGRARASRRA